MSLGRRRYRWLLRLLAPALLWLGRKQDPARWRERLARYAGPLPERPIWLHAASYGEAKAAGALIEALRAEGYAGPWLVTTTTRTGAEQIAPWLRPGDRHLYAPLDLPGVVRRALTQIQPRLLLVLEVEIWPTLWLACQRRQIPVVLANARLSESSLSKYQRYLPALWRATLQSARLILAQSEPIAARFRQLGVRDTQLQLAGNLKYSQPLPADITAQGEALRRLLGTARPVWLAASTHDGEEAIALRCQQQLLQQHPDALLVLVPRHPHRFDQVASLCAQSGLAWQRRSEAPAEAVAERTQLYLADTLGELLAFYAAADLALVAGSFVDVGGHNILEPAGCGCPMIVGPDMRNFEAILNRFAADHALQQVTSARELEDAIPALLANPQARRPMAQRALTLYQREVGAAAEQATAIQRLLPTATGKG